MQSLIKRQEERSQTLKQSLSDRAEKESENITAILTELQDSIRLELAEPAVEQLELFSSAEREQFERNVGSLRSRLEQIPMEIEEETRLVRSRFADPQSRLFPLAVMYLVPEKLLRS